MRGLFLEGPIFGGAYVRKEICALKSIRLALFLVGYLPFFFLFHFVFEGNSQVQAPPGDYIGLEGDLTEDFFVL